jgi:hypothetical protein
LADGALTVGSGETDPSFRQSIQMGGLDDPITGTPHGIMTMLVAEDIDYIGLFIRHGVTSIIEY